jgi:hypothetical protein
MKMYPFHRMIHDFFQINWTTWAFRGAVAGGHHKMGAYALSPPVYDEVGTLIHFYGTCGPMP